MGINDRTNAEIYAAYVTLSTLANTECSATTAEAIANALDDLREPYDKFNKDREELVKKYCKEKEFESKEERDKAITQGTMMYDKPAEGTDERKEFDDAHDALVKETQRCPPVLQRSDLGDLKLTANKFTALSKFLRK